MESDTEETVIIYGAKVLRMRGRDHWKRIFRRREAPRIGEFLESDFADWREVEEEIVDARRVWRMPHGKAEVLWVGLDSDLREWTGILGPGEKEEFEKLKCRHAEARRVLEWIAKAPWVLRLKWLLLGPPDGRKAISPS